MLADWICPTRPLILSTCSQTFLVSIQPVQSNQAVGMLSEITMLDEQPGDNMVSRRTYHASRPNLEACPAPVVPWLQRPTGMPVGVSLHASVRATCINTLIFRRWILRSDCWGLPLTSKRKQFVVDQLPNCIRFQRGANEFNLKVAPERRVPERSLPLLKPRRERRQGRPQQPRKNHAAVPLATPAVEQPAFSSCPMPHPVTGKPSGHLMSMRFRLQGCSQMRSQRSSRMPHWSGFECYNRASSFNSPQ